MTARGIFVAGTDTGVGKTRAAVALLRAHVAAGRRAVGMKPVAAGIDAGADVNADVAALAAAGNVGAPLSARNPYAFAAPVAPHIAAAAAGVAIDVERIAAAYAALAAAADVVVVEGAGGVIVPLGPRTDMLDVAGRLGLPVLLVVGLKLGCLNHALLAEQALRQRGVRLSGWVANGVDPAMAAQQENVAALRVRLPAPLVAFAGYGAPLAFDRRWVDALEPC